MRAPLESQSPRIYLHQTPRQLNRSTKSSQAIAQDHGSPSNSASLIYGTACTNGFHRARLQSCRKSPKRCGLQPRRMFLVALKGFTHPPASDPIMSSMRSVRAALVMSNSTQPVIFVLLILFTGNFAARTQQTDSGAL